MDFTAIKRVRSSVLKKVELVGTNSNLLISSASLSHLLTELCTSHHLKGCKLLLPCLARDEKVSQDHLLRATLIIISSMMQQDGTSLSDQTKRLMDTFFESICLKQEILAEFLVLLIGNDHFKDAKDEFTNAWNRHEILYITIDVMEKLSIGASSLLNFVDYINRINSNSLFSSEEELKMILDQVLTSMLAIVKRESGPHDFLIPRVLDILIDKDLISEAIECLTEYKNLNKGNLNAYIYLYQFMVNCAPDEPDYQKIIKECFDKIVELSPSSLLILEMLDSCEVEPCYVCKILMEFIDYSNNKENLNAWQILADYLEKLAIIELDTILDHYKSKYESYWPQYHWGSLESDETEINSWKQKVQSILTQNRKPTKTPKKAKRKSSIRSSKRVKKESSE